MSPLLIPNTRRVITAFFNFLTSLAPPYFHLLISPQIQETGDYSKYDAPTGQDVSNDVVLALVELNLDLVYPECELYFVCLCVGWHYVDLGRVVHFKC